MNDIRFAFRQLSKNPGFTVVAILTLALGIGSCTAMFSVVHAVLLEPLPFQEPERLVWIENVGTGGLSERTTRVDNFMEWRAQSGTFEDLAAYFAFFDYQRLTLTGSGEPRRLRGVGVSREFLDVLGVQPRLGRNFVPEESAWNGRPAAILSNTFWVQEFAADPAIVGRSITVDGKPTEVIGVLPASFDFDDVFAPGADADLLTAFPLVEQTATWGNTLFVIGRLKPGVTLTQAQSELDVISGRVSAAHPERGVFGARAVMLNDHIRGAFRQAFYLLSGAVGFLLLIACVNLSNLLLARANARRQEFSVRSALGAHPWHLVRQATTETLLLAFAGSILGVVVAVFGIKALASLQAFNIPLLQSAAVDATACAFTVATTCVAAFLCAALPALQLWRRDPGEGLNDSGRGSLGKNAVLVRKTLVVSEIALACMLLVGAGLLIRSFVDVLKMDLAFEPEHAMAWRVDSTRDFNSADEAVRYYGSLAERIAAIPGVESVGLSDTLPLGRNRAWGAAAKGVEYPPYSYPSSSPRIVDQNYLQTMRIPLRAGRYFDQRDSKESEPAIIINETMARALWPDRNAVAQTVVVGGPVGTDMIVVGVVADVPPGLEQAPRAEMYLDFRQTMAWAAMELVVRTNRTPASLIPDVRAALNEFDPALPSGEFTTLGELVDSAVAPRRFITTILGSFSSLALALAAIGLYGVVAWSVGQRTREMGIRFATGAQRGDVLRLVLGEGLKIAVVGVAVGLLAAFFLSRLLESLLVGVTATDPLVFVANASIVVGVALLASLIPARRAARVEPMQALRSE